MWDGLVPFGQGQVSGDGPPGQGEMPSSSGDDTPSASDSKNVGGLASVFKGLAGAAKLTKSPPTSLAPILPSSMTASIIQQDGASDSDSNGLPPAHVEALERLRNGTPAERIGAAQQLRMAVTDYPLNPVRLPRAKANDLRLSYPGEPAVLTASSGP